MNPLKDWREKRGKSLRELSELSGVNPATISKIENGHVFAQGRTLRKLADALDAPIEDFASLRDIEVTERAKKAGRASADQRKAQRDQAEQEEIEDINNIPESRAA